MPNEKAPVCGCRVVMDLPTSRSESITSRKLTIFIPKSKGAKADGGKASKKQHQQHQQEESRGPKNRTSETGGSSSIETQQHSRQPAAVAKNKQKRMKQARRTRSADRAESHYTYIDSGSSIIGGGIREDAIPEALYATIPDTIPSGSVELAGGHSNTHRSQPVYAIPSMTSPPPTYDAAIAKTWQFGLPPTYEEYLCHKYAMMSRSHTPPPPWSDSSPTTTSSSNVQQQNRRDMLASQPELREYLAQRILSQNNERISQHYQQIGHQGLREQQARPSQRARQMPARSQSETRAQQQQRIATMYEEVAFCMETTALQSAFEHGITLCSLM